MKLTVYRCETGFVASPECMQAPLGVQREHPCVCNCGTLEVQERLMPHVAVAVIRDGFAVVLKSDRSFPIFESLCARPTAIPA